MPIINANSRIFVKKSFRDIYFKIKLTSFTSVTDITDITVAADVAFDNVTRRSILTTSGILTQTLNLTITTSKFRSAIANETSSAVGI